MIQARKRLALVAGLKTDTDAGPTATAPRFAATAPTQGFRITPTITPAVKLKQALATQAMIAAYGRTGPVDHYVVVKNGH